MFIDKIEIHDNVIKINNNEFIQIRTQNSIYSDLKNSEDVREFKLHDDVFEFL